MKYKGIVSDAMRTLRCRYTHVYCTYKAAHDAAEKLAKKHYPTRSYICIVGVPEPGDERREPSHV